MSVPSFKRNKPKPLKTREFTLKRKSGGHKLNFRERGYTTEWDHLRNAYIRDHPLCEEHLRQGYVRSAELVDHVIPVVEDPSLILKRDNLDALCNDCHNVFKRRIEKYAKMTGQVDKLPEWIKTPLSRPMAFQIKRTGPVGEDGQIR